MQNSMAIIPDMQSKPIAQPPSRARAKIAAGTHPSSAKVERGQLTPQDWINAARELLIHRSIDAVRVDVLAKILVVTRGSFYWHFTDRDELLQRVLLSWQEEQTEQVIARYRKKGVAAQDLIRELTELPFHGRAAIKGGSVELAIRAWARRDEMARDVVDKVDAKRLEYIQECFSHLGFQRSEAKARAFLLYCYMQSESLFSNQGSAGDKECRRELVANLVLAPL